MLCLVLLAKPAPLSLKDFYAQERAGLDPVFDPVKLGIRNTICWITGTNDDGADQATPFAKRLPVPIRTTSSQSTPLQLFLRIST